nr:family 20 glycosylhydrolase [Shewanella sp. SNU WT4]
MNRFDLLSMPLRSVPALATRARLALTASATLGMSVMLIFSANAQALTNAETKISGMQGSATNTIVTQGEDSQPSESQAKLAAFAQQLKLEYQLINNTQGRDCLTADNNAPSAQTSETAPKLSCFNAQLVMTSTVDYSADVSIFFSHIRPISRVLTPLFTIKRIQGDLHQLQATPQFQGFKAGDTVTIPFVAELWQLAESDAMPNYYLVQAGLAPEVIHSTQLQLEAETGMEIRPFVNAYDNAQLQFKSSATDEVTWVTPQSIFAENQDTPRNEAGVSSQIIPTPTAVQLIKAPPLSLASGLKIQGYANSNKIAMESALTYLASLGMTQSSSGVSLALSLDPSLGIEAYRLAINDAGIAIVGGSDTGVFYGLMSLVSVYDINTQSVAQLTVVDAPRYSFRGFHLDVARNFHGVAQIEKLLEQMAAFKLNKLHLHMADDEGWRLAIAGLPELTDVGAKRCHDLTEKTCLLPQLGSGPNADSSVNGYYSREQYIHLVKFAAARHIQIIPSMDMPGHSRAAIKAMDARSARLAPAIANQYQLSDPQDKTQYSSIQHYNDNTINVCLESSFAFIDKVINEIALMHQEAGAALTRYHIGADETAGAWLKSPACAAFIANNPYGVTDMNQLGGYFIERISQMLAQKGIEVAGWSDGMSHTRIENMPTIVQSNVWDSLHAGGHKRAHQQANLGWDVVLSVPDVLYFDMPHAADPKEHGYYWATRASSSRKVFEFMPGNLAANAEQ